METAKARKIRRGIKSLHMLGSLRTIPLYSSNPVFLNSL